MKAGKWIFIISACLLVIGALTLRQSGSIFVSPDETAAQFFSSAYAKSGMLSVAEPLSATLGDALHPRSMLSLDGRLVPGSFLGLPLILGSVAAILGTTSIPFVPILFSLLAVLAWAAIWRRWLGDRAGWLAGALLALLPAWWYYTARSLMPNVTFVACLIFALWFFVCRPFGGENAERLSGTNPPPSEGGVKGWLSRWFQTHGDSLLAGACLGFALFVRLSEAAWVGLVVIALLIWQRKNLTKRSVIAFLCGVVLVLSPLPFLQKSLYGSYGTNGYTALQEISNGETTVHVPPPEGGAGIWQKTEQVLQPLFPFGIHPRLAWRQFVDYGLGMFWWTFLFAAIGVGLLLLPTTYNPQPKTSRFFRAYLAVTAFVSVWLILMYGSWTFTDNPDPTQITIGNSHVRYWLPIFVLLTPLAAFAIDGCAKWIEGVLTSKATTRVDGIQRPAGRRTSVAVLISLWIIYALFGFQSVFFTPQDGLIAEANVLAQSRVVHDDVLKLTESNAVIVVDRDDKLFFPDRQVIYPLRSDKTYALLPQIAAVAPLYYYGITLPPADLNYLNTDKLKASGLMFAPVETFGIETLYRVQ